MRAFYVLLLLLATSAAAADAPDIDLAAFANGALIESSTSNYPGWEASYLLDESPQKGWSSLKGAHLPFTIVISLAERSTIRTLAFDNHADSLKRGTKDIEVAVSDTSATAGFATILTTALQPAAGAQLQKFALPVPVTGRWLRLTIKSNQGDPDYTEMADFYAYGRQLTQTPLPSGLSGTYASSNYGAFHLLQKGAELTGCYEYSAGLIQGGLESHLMRLTWSQANNASGPAVMVLKRSGDGFAGWWRHAKDNTWTNDWDLRKVSDKVGSCSNWNPEGSVIASELSDQGRSRLYGINFDTDSANLRADAQPEVSELLSVLKANPGWRVSIEGHTDSTGSAPHNLDLSKRRAESVMTALVKGGIAAGRMSAQGFGQAKPVAGNDTELGRAQNRRVEVVRS